MTLALALGALALFDERRARRCPAGTRGAPVLSWPHHPLFYGDAGPVRAGDGAAAGGRLDPAARASSPGGGRDAHHVRHRGDVAVLRSASRWFVLLAARTPVKRRSTSTSPAILCGLAVLAQGAGRPGAAGDRVRRPTWCSPGTGAAWAGRRCGYGAARCRCWRARWWRCPGTTPCASATAARCWNELFGDNHWRRLMIGRHGDRGTFEYFLRELGYGAAAAGWRWCRRRWAGRFCGEAGGGGGRATSRPRRASRTSSGWARSGSWPPTRVVSLSMTKFHHYILPAMPGPGAS